MPRSAYLNMSINNEDLQWGKELNKKFRYHMTLIHIPTGITIEQASERNWSECKTLCLNSLKWKLSLENGNVINQ